ncbi:MAG: hypothetical protein M3O36_07860, partial [Myxococcota bacterium]|nr:hypothetical protein [Myxococcota bacterium]
ASADGASSGVAEGSVVSAGDGSAAADVSATFAQRYEAEAVPPNALIQSAVADHTCYGTGTTCPAGPLKEGASCCSGGGEVKQLLGRVPCAPKDYQNCQKIGAGVEFHAVTVPADGTYDVTWWYHCGLNDFFGDKACGGVHYSVGTSCRPHLIDVNGAPMSSSVGGQTALFFQFPCYPGAWSILHASTTALPLKAGANVITLHAPHEITLDAVDLDALEVLPKGMGAPPLVTPVVSGF